VALPGVTSKIAAGRNEVVKAVFLDRDGVINANIERNGKPVAPVTIEQFQLLPGVVEAAKRLKAAGYLLIVVTNQPDVASGRTPKATVEAMHAEIRRQLPVDDIKACYHLDRDQCGCRKPKPGLILEAAAQHGIDLASSFMVGDRWRDTAAGKAAGCLTIFVDCGYEQDGPNRPDMIARSLPDAVTQILARL
jgi:D-glycero-D-manno-heptose 1,7-bisphosphate phosphatase